MKWEETIIPRMKVTNEQREQGRVSFKAGARAMFQLMTDEKYAHIKFHQREYDEFVREARVLGL